MLRPFRYLLFTQLALSSALIAGEKKVLLDDLFFDSSTIADSSKYPASLGSAQDQSLKVSLQQKEHYTLMGEMLYLKPGFDSLPWFYVIDYAQANDVSLPSTTFSAQSTQLKVIDLPFDFGFRLAAGFNPTWLNLNLLLSWERFYTSGSSSVPQISEFTVNNYNQPTAYISFWNGNGPAGQINVASQTSSFDWDQIDFIGAICLKAMNRLTLSPLLGLRGLITKFNSTINYSTNQYGSTTVTAPPFNQSVTALKQKFNAIGLVGGLDGDLDFGRGFHLKALMEGSVTFGELKTQNNQQVIVPIGSQVPTVRNQELKTYGFKPMLDAQVALFWTRAFYENKMKLDIHLGYEAHFIPNFFQFITKNNYSRFFDLTMQGLDAGIGLSF